MDAPNSNTTPKYYNLTAAAEILAVKPGALLRALAQLPALKRRNGLWTIEDLAQIDAVMKTMVPKLARQGEL